MVLKNIWRRVIANILINSFPSNIFLIMQDAIDIQLKHICYSPAQLMYSLAVQF